MSTQQKVYRIGDLAKNLHVERFVIRFWEKEFGVKSQRSKGGQRYYMSNDMKMFFTIKKLLYEEGFTIAGAKKMLSYPANDQTIVASHKTDMHISPLPNCVIEILKQCKEKLLILRQNI